MLNYELDLWGQPPTLAHRLKKLSLQVSIARQRVRLSVSEAASELALTKLSLQPLKQQRHEQETALKILVGRIPENIVNGLIYRDKPIDYFPALPVLPKILPSELLEQKPDIKAAEQTLLAADANLKTIKATYFP
ncbi:TolC family protein [Rickettsia massiliae]|uniref:TolC family protein n=1 Tax=Rickettsia massiliae TaxID=35791 RepID=UPI000310F429|nr:RND transporter [Rickettsia massiliae]